MVDKRQSPLMALFNVDGFPVKFFIQQDLPKVLMQELAEDIESHGGCVASKVPQQGYILVQPGTDEAIRLKERWITNDKPGRHIVPYSFIRTCVRGSRLYKQIFLLSSGARIPFYVHSSIRNINLAEKAKERILCCGGEVVDHEEDADVIIGNSKDESQWKTLLRQYKSSESQYLETSQWIKRCMDQGEAQYTPVEYKDPGGRIQGSARNEYTEEEDRLLAQYIARRIPSKAGRGRTGNNLYKELREWAETGKEGFQWAMRHTWQSWLNRYKQNMTRFDKVIEEYVKEHDIQIGERGQQGYSRKGTSSHLSRNSGSHVPQGASKATAFIHEQPRPRSPSLTPPLKTKPQRLSERSSSDPTNTIRDDLDGDGDDQWPIQIGNDPPPRWASKSRNKRKRSEIESHESSDRSRPESRDLVTNTEGSGEPYEEVNDPKIQEELVKIAENERWHVTDVIVEYGRQMGDLTKTRKKVHEYRMLIDGIREREG